MTIVFVHPSLFSLFLLLLQSDKDTAGPGWFDLPATEVTPEIKKDLQLIKLRAYVDPKRFYKVYIDIYIHIIWN